MCQLQHPHKCEGNFKPNDWIAGIIAISKSDRENESTFPTSRRGRAFMPNRPEPPPPACLSTQRLWQNLPESKRKRLISILSQMLENQISASVEKEATNEPQH